MNTEQTNMPTRTFAKRTAISILNAKNFTVGSVLEGLWFDQRVRMITDKKTGELKEITDLLFKKDDGSQVALPLDAGLRIAMSEYNVKTGEFVQIEKKPQIEYNGNNVNQYDIKVALH
jgi:hypothetical protein